MLLQKREENAITLAATANNAKIIDEPVTDGGPVSPVSYTHLDVYKRQVLTCVSWGHFM